MAYEKVYKGQRETGVVNRYEYVDEQGNNCIHEFPETEPHHEIEWVLKWQPEHAPVGSVVRYKSSRMLADEDELREVTVTGHYWNGIKSWVILTDDVCPILGHPHKCSFNGDHLREIVSRGKGGVQFTNNKNTLEHFANTYKASLKEMPAGKKRSHQYAGNYLSSIVGYVLTTHPKFSGYFDGMHDNMGISEISNVLGRQLGIRHPVRWDDHVVVSKKKLINALTRLIARGRTSKLVAYKAEQKAAAEDYRRDMESFCDDL